MEFTIEPRLERWLRHWHGFVERWALVIVLGALVLTGVTMKYVAGNLGINTDTVDLLSEDLPWRQTYLHYREVFPQYTDVIAVVVEGRTPDRVQDAAITLAERLRGERDVIEWVYEPEFSPFMRRQGLLFLDTDELHELSDRLAEVQPFLSRLVRDQTVHGFAGVLTEATDELAGGGDIPVERTFDSVADTVHGVLRDERRRLSWQSLMSGRTVDDEDLRTVLMVKPELDFAKLLPGETAVLRIREIARELGLRPDNGVQVRLTGDAALGYEELRSVTQGAKTAGLLAMVMVSVVLVLGLRSVWLVLASLATLVIGLVLTAGFATVAIGELNLLSVAFAVLYIGLGVDFAIHYCLRYRELRASEDPGNALADTSTHIGSSLALCALTTAIGFYAFVPTAYTGVAELGLIAGTGMFVSLFTSLTVLPALLKPLPIRPRIRWGRAGFAGTILTVPSRHARGICAGAAVLGIGALAVLPTARFDHNPIHLQDPGNESVQTYRDLLAESARSPLSVVAIAGDRAQAERLVREFRALAVVENAMSVDDLIPENQQDKLAIISDMSLVLGPDLTPRDQPPSHTPAETASTLRALTRALDRYLASPHAAGKTAASAKRLREALDTFLQSLTAGSAGRRATRLAQLEQDLLANFPGRLRALREGLRASAFTVADLPESIRERWISDGGRYRVEAFPRENLDDNAALERFVARARSVAPELTTGSPVVNVEASAAVVNAFQQAFVSALVVIAVLLFVLLRRHQDIVMVLAPLILAGLLTGATAVLIGMPFNFANIIALPLLLGIGVDSALHILHRYRTALPANGVLLQTSTARGVVLSALTTGCGFGNLAVSSHVGTASMGVMLTIGVMFTLICSLILLPSMLELAGEPGGRTA